MDLIERLRAEADAGCNDIPYCNLLLEAADEIKRRGATIALLRNEIDVQEREIEKRDRWIAEDSLLREQYRKALEEVVERTKGPLIDRAENVEAIARKALEQDNGPD